MQGQDELDDLTGPSQPAGGKKEERGKQAPSSENIVKFANVRNLWRVIKAVKCASPVEEGAVRGPQLTWGCWHARRNKTKRK